MSTIISLEGGKLNVGNCNLSIDEFPDLDKKCDLLIFIVVFVLSIELSKISNLSPYLLFYFLFNDRCEFDLLITAFLRSPRVFASIFLNLPAGFYLTLIVFTKLTY